MNPPSTATDDPTATPEDRSDLQHVLAVYRLSHKYSGTIGSRRASISGLLFERSIVALNSAIILIRAAAYDDAAILIRTLFEIEFQLGVIKADPNVAVKLGEATEKFRGRRLHALIQRKRKFPEGITEALREQSEKALSSGAAKPPAIELAKMAGLSYEYDTFYSLLSEIAHVTPKGLAHYLIEDPVSGKREVNPKGSLLAPEYLIVLAAATQLNILDLAAQILNDTHPPEYEELRTQNGELISRVHNKILSDLGTA
jgi:hypothetical protein